MNSKITLILFLLVTLTACGDGDDNQYTLINEIPNNTPQPERSTTPVNGEGDSTSDPSEEITGPGITETNGELVTSTIVNDILDVIALSDIALNATLSSQTYLNNQQASQDFIPCENENEIFVDRLDPSFGPNNGLTISLHFGDIDNNSPISYCKLNGYFLSGSITLRNINYTLDQNSNWTLEAKLSTNIHYHTLETNNIKYIEGEEAISFNASNEIDQQGLSITKTSLSINIPVTIQQSTPGAADAWYINELSLGLTIQTQRAPDAFIEIDSSYITPKYEIGVEGIVINSLTGSNRNILVTTNSAGGPLQWIGTPESTPPASGGVSIQDNTDGSSSTINLNYGIPNGNTSTSDKEYSLSLRIIDGSTGTETIDTQWFEFLNIARIATTSP